MTRSITALRRRRLLGLVPASLAAAASCAPSPASAARTAEEAPFPDAPGVLVAGPDGGALSRWADVIAPSLGRALPAAFLRETAVGGVDGVTGANQFDTRVAPDGSTVLLAPGDAGLAWLVGDARARFDISHWVPVLAGATPSVLAGRAPLAPGRAVRIGAAGPAGPDLPALLALDRLGVPCEPVFGLTEQAALAAFAEGRTDVVLLRGAGVPARLAALQDGRALFGFGAFDGAGQMIRDPLLPDVPALSELRGLQDGALLDAWRATAAASQLAFALVLPRLTPPAAVALWRRAGASAAAAPETQAMAAASATRTLAPQAAAAGFSRISADAAGLLELRRWLADRYGWHAG